MRPDHFGPHVGPHVGPGGFGFWHGPLELLWFGVPALIALALLGALVWLLIRALSGGRNRRPPQVAPIASGGASASAIEILRQRYARGEIDGDTFQVMLNQLRASGSATESASADPGDGGEGGRSQNV